MAEPALRDTEPGQSVFPLERNPDPTPLPDRERLLRNPPWGRVFTDHIFTLRYTNERGWHDGRIQPLKSLDLHPGAMVLHFALGVFEGLKAYRQQDGGAALFRPGANARRLNSSAERLAIPALPDGMFVESVRALSRVEQDWISCTDDATLYLRPFIISTEAALGTKIGEEFLYTVVASPVCGFFKPGAFTVTVWVSETYTRAAPGGTGAAKCGGNYAAGLAAQAQAKREGCDQVVFLDTAERRWVEEFGAMNAFFVFDDDSLLTPPLSDTILPGITRDSLITLARDLGHVVREEPYSIEQWQADARSGRLREAFACGTAAVVTPVVGVKARRYGFTIGDGNAGPVTRRLKQELTDIQFGRALDRHAWLDRLF